MQRSSGWLESAPTDVAAGFGVIHGGSTKLVVAVRLGSLPTSYGIVVKVACGQDAFELNHWRRGVVSFQMVEIGSVGT
ncbi:hypothetical protein DY000_02032648 [Brassica cretica]|uniref:Uncharacterized protein n=1 Tax=Brassica cretica TaxID=69181 RepID=A0ABQ7DC04_BRACR|nr:hypothetical protein DY000_02032648 [Brassica cretica]